MDRDERARIFCSLELPDDVVDAFVVWQASLGDGRFRLVPRENLHVTLAFLGRTPVDRIDEVVGALRDVARDALQPAFEVDRYRETANVGMLACGDEDGRGARLAAALGARLENAGLYRPERRPWLPHVTVVRFRKRPLLRPRLPELGSFVTSDAAVNMSVLRPTGAQYTKIDSVALGG